MQVPIFLHPYFREKIWGGSKLRTDFHFNIPSDQTGEAWVISGHKNGQSIVTAPKQLKGKSLAQVYTEHPELFAHPTDPNFPLLVKILDAQADLSVQVHPDDHYARIHENDLGKTECWYILSAEPGAKIIYGHHASSPEDFRRAVDGGDWQGLLRELPVKAGEFYDVPHGTIHAIGAGITILETQQSSDTTYRVYDYGRVDSHGNKRDLHLDDAIAVSQIPHQDPAAQSTVTHIGQSAVTHYLSNDFFSLSKWEVNEDLQVDLPGPYTLATVIEGSGDLIVAGETYPIEKGHSFILPAGVDSIDLTGDMTLISSYPIRT